MTTYYLCIPDDSHDWAEVWGAGDELAIICSTCGRAISQRVGGGWSPLCFRIPPGKPHGNMYHYTYDILVDEWAKQVLSAHVHEGIAFIEARIIDSAEVRLWSVEVSNRCAMHPACNVQLITVCPECGLRRYSTWDGGVRIVDCTHDIFRLNEHPGYVFVKESLKQALEAAKLKNLAFVDASSVHDVNARYQPKRRE